MSESNAGECVNGHEPEEAKPEEPSPREASTPAPCAEEKPETKTQTTSAKAKTKDHAQPDRNPEGPPSQVKVGRWSRHSRIVTANRALFEGMGSDVARIGLFEASPVVDPTLMENSERILSKVQTLARMYSAKASTMKVPLHQKRASAVRTQSWGSARVSGPSTQSQSQTRAKQQTQGQTETGSTETQTNSETNAESQTRTQTRQQTQTRTSCQYQSQTTSWDGPRVQEEGLSQRAESRTDGGLASRTLLRPAALFRVGCYLIFSFSLLF